MRLFVVIRMLAVLSLLIRNMPQLLMRSITMLMAVTEDQEKQVVTVFVTFVQGCFVLIVAASVVAGI